MLSLYLAAAPMRLRHYAEAGGRAMLRQWQGMLILGLLVVGQATTILMLPAAMLAGLVRSPNAVGVATLLAAAMLYVLPQRAVLRGGGMRGYAATLPIPGPVRLLLDATVLLLADALLGLELVLAAAIGGMGTLPGLMGLLFAVLAVQLVMLRLTLPDPRRAVRALPLPALLRTNLQVLAERPVTNGGRYLVALAAAAAGAAIATAFHFDGRALPVAIGALALSGFAAEFPEFTDHPPATGVYGERCDARRVLREDDRVELYRPLVFDPLESRRRRAAHRQDAAQRPARSGAPRA